MSRFSAIAAVLLLAGCGFQLQGELTTPAEMERTFIAAEDRNTGFYRAFRRSLNEAGVSVVDNPADATATFSISFDQTGQRVLSVSARNVPTEYEVFYSIEYALDSTQDRLLDQQTLTLTRNYTYDPTLVLGKAREEELLREAIITGKIAPGERLKVETLKETLATGASPVREALSLLTSDQLVERLDQRGFRVAKASQKQFQEILGLRCHLEDLALRESIQLGGQDWEEALVLAHHRMARAERDQPEVLEARHKDFHMARLAACGSPILLRFCGQLYDLNVRYRNLAGTAKSYSNRHVEEEHRAILDAANERDIDKTSDLLRTH